MLFSGCGVALVTPFTQDGIDFAALQGLAEWQIESGTDALVVLGTTGEACLMSDRERESALAFVLEVCDGRAPVIAGCGCCDTEETVRRAKRCESLGADALLAVTPYYLKTSQEGLYGHYMRLADSCHVPVILYNVPGRTGVNLLPETVERLSHHPMVAGLKEAGSDMAQLAETIRRTDGKLAVYSGNDEMTLAAMALGARGVISVAANVEPEKMREMTHRALEGDFAGAREIQLEMLPLMKALFVQPNPIPVKAALAMMGKIRENLRMPLVPLEAAYRQELMHILNL